MVQCPNQKNLADTESKGSLLSKIVKTLWKSPSSIAENNKWSDQSILSDSKQSDKEVK